LPLTDTKADNILSQIEDKSIHSAFTAAEMEHPSPRKSVNGVTVYASRQLEVPKFFGDSVLSDFGSAVRGDEKRNHNAGPQVYRVRIILPLISRFLTAYVLEHVSRPLGP
jgi:serine/threonine-protein kinase SRPK3